MAILLHSDEPIGFSEFNRLLDNEPLSDSKELPDDKELPQTPNPTTPSNTT